MDKVQDEFEQVNHDDVSVLRVLLHNIRGISPVSTNQLDFIPVDDDDVDVET